jgi:hypothetical protein
MGHIVAFYIQAGVGLISKSTDVRSAELGKVLKIEFMKVIKNIVTLLRWRGVGLGGMLCTACASEIKSAKVRALDIAPLALYTVLRAFT